MSAEPIVKLCSQISLAVIEAEDQAVPLPKRIKARQRMRKYIKDLNRRCGVKEAS